MIDFWFALIWMMVFVLPAIWILLGIAYVINKKLPMGTPWLSDLPMNIGISLLNMMNNCASNKEIRLAARSAILVSGAITAIFQQHLLFHSIVWVILICFLLSFVED
ncbi:MAG: hypothetical protein U7127_03975 [Phormidium sp.]